MYSFVCNKMVPKCLHLDGGKGHIWKCTYIMSPSAINNNAIPIFLFCKVRVWGEIVCERVRGERFNGSQMAARRIPIFGWPSMDQLYNTEIFQPKKAECCLHCLYYVRQSHARHTFCSLSLSLSLSLRHRANEQQQKNLHKKAINLLLPFSAFPSVRH